MLRHSLRSVSLLHSTIQTSYMVYIHEICCVQSVCCTLPFKRRISSIYTRFAAFSQFAALYHSNAVHGLYTRDLLRSVSLLHSTIQTSYIVYIHEICCVQSVCCTLPFKRRAWSIYTRFAVSLCCRPQLR